jgi:Zn finger protein HypA/HybF involved in hydrogenase expression
MNQIDVKTAKYNHTCLRCGKSWPSNIPNPQECSKCRSRSWNVPANETARGAKYDVNMPIPKFEHKKPLSLPFIGAKCPYCRGTTGLDTFRVVAFCYSCDFAWTIKGEPKGVLQGIGLR